MGVWGSNGALSEELRLSPRGVAAGASLCALVLLACTDFIPNFSRVTGFALLLPAGAGLIWLAEMLPPGWARWVAISVTTASVMLAAGWLEAPKGA